MKRIGNLITKLHLNENPQKTFENYLKGGRLNILQHNQEDPQNIIHDDGSKNHYVGVADHSGIPGKELLYVGFTSRYLGDENIPPSEILAYTNIKGEKKTQEMTTFNASTGIPTNKHNFVEVPHVTRYLKQPEIEKKLNDHLERKNGQPSRADELHQKNLELSKQPVNNSLTVLPKKNTSMQPFKIDPPKQED